MVVPFLPSAEVFAVLAFSSRPPHRSSMLDLDLGLASGSGSGSGSDSAPDPYPDSNSALPEDFQ